MKPERRTELLIHALGWQGGTMAGVNARLIEEEERAIDKAVQS